MPVQKREVLIRPLRRGFQSLIIGTTVLIALGGGTHPLTLGLFTIVLGLAIAVRPHYSGLGGLAGLCWISLCTWMLLALALPAPDVEWRFAADYVGIDIGSAVSPQPWVTIEALVAFLTGSALLVLAISCKPYPSQQKWCTHLLSFTLTLLGIGAIIAASLGWRLPWATEVQVFSWFPNRNQTALTFACGSVLSFGLAFLPWYRRSLELSMAKQADKAPSISVYTASMKPFIYGSILLYATFQSLSRGALIAWSCGMLTLVILRVARTDLAASRLMRFAPALAILLFSFFVFMGGESRDRMMETIAQTQSSDGDIARIADIRGLIYADTVTMIADQSLTGVGLGQFRYVFPQYRSASASIFTIRHPESDWLWWTAELGLVGLVFLVVGLGSLLWRLRHSKAEKLKELGSENGPIDLFYRHIALAALVPFFIHSLVDVGAHRLGTVSLAIVLYTLALPQAAETALPPKIVRRLWCGVGALLLLLGVGTTFLAAVRSTYLTTYATEADRPSPTVPLQWQPYFRSAVQMYPDDPLVALDTFFQARFLMPDNVDIPLSEGLFLLSKNDRSGAFAAFSSAIRRSNNPVEPFQEILYQAVSKPAYHEHLRTLAQTNEEMITAYWRTMPAEFLKADVLMSNLTKDWHILPAWAQQSILEKLNQRKLYDSVQTLFQSSQADKQKQIWPVAMQTLVAKDRWEEALALFEQWEAPKPLPDETLSDDALRQLQATALVHSEDPVIAARLIRAYLTREMWNEVRRTAERARVLPGSPPDTLYWLGRALSETNYKREAASAYAEWLSIRSNQN